MTTPDPRRAARRVVPASLPIALLAVALLAAAAPLAASPGASALASTMSDVVREQRLEGVVWSTVAADGAITTGAAGIRDARTGIPLRPDDRVHVGSIAKSLLAVGVLRLVTEGRLSLDAPVPTLLPGIAFDSPWADEAPVTVRHLLDHTAGLDDARLSQVMSLRADADAPLAAAFAGRGPLRVRCRPGTRHSYSNTGYTLLGMIVEAVTGARYETYLDAHLLRPLGMRDSTFAYTTQSGPGHDPRLAMGHFEDGMTQAAVPAFLRPSMQFATTAADMGRFARFLMGDGRVDGRPFIGPELLRAMGTPVATEAAATGLRVGYGLGMSTRDRHGVVGRCHGGSTVGFKAMLCLYPDARRAYFYASNTDREAGDYGALDRALIEASGLRGQSPATATAAGAGAPEGADPAPWTGWYVPSPNRFATFAWLDTAFGFARLEADAGALRFVPFQGAAVELSPAGGTTWRAPDRMVASHALIVAADGARIVSTGSQSWERVGLPKLAALWTSLAAGLAGLLWLLVAGGARAFRAGGWRQPTTWPFVGVVLLFAPLPLLLRQSFLAFGDPTPANVALATATALLPLSMGVGLVLAWRRRERSVLAAVDIASMLGVLQWAGVLAYWGLLPTRLWT